MPQPEVTPQEFAIWWDVLNAEFPPYKVPADELARQSRRWFHELRLFSRAALEDALRTWMRSSERRPKLTHILAGAQAYNRRIDDALDIRGRQVIEHDGNRCACGCGGLRWARVITDSAGNPRFYPKAMGQPSLPDGIMGAARGAITREFESLADTPMTADLVECRRLGISRVPTDTGELVGMDERGVGVWRLNRLQLEDAA